MRALIIAGSAVAAATGTLQADVLFSNFGSDDTYVLDIGETLSFGGPLGGQVNEHAVPFTVTGGDYYLDSAEVAILHSWGPDLVYADIRSDDGGAPGEVLESTSGTGVTEPFVWAPPMQLEFSGELLLEEGQQYWLALRTEETDALLAWAHNVIDDFGLRAWRIDYGPWNTAYGEPGTDTQRAVYRVHATPLSECPADIDGDGFVDVQDLVAVIVAWGSNDPDADIDGSGLVDVGDLVQVIVDWGEC